MMTIARTAFSRAVLFVCVLLAGASVAAQTVTLTCGGNSQDEFARIMGDGEKHALLILFVSKNMDYLSGVQTRVENAAGNTLAERACGPLGQMDVSAPGRYKITVHYNGAKKTREVELQRTGNTRLLFVLD
ncbi:MAG: hypothetical protein LBO79_01335 [Zoogloeaceae bacterium]|jgi:hypothetical protein|nr:hypothetical protein [Zoogloeaceae bacterium]